MLRSPRFTIGKLQWGPALKAGRNFGKKQASRAGRFRASMGPGPKGREERWRTPTRRIAISCFNGARP